MDGKSFDRLSVVLHRLHKQGTRRGALGLILGGSLAAVNGLLAGDADAKKKNGRHKNKKKRHCRSHGGWCDSHGDCCDGNCWGGRCWSRGRHGLRCGGQHCAADWGCCTSSGVSACVPFNVPTCCGNYGFASGYTCCGGYGGACLGGLEACTGQFGICCQPGWKHCHNSFTSTCIPNTWDCDRFFSQSSQSAGLTVESAEPIPTADPIEVPVTDWVELRQG